MGTDAGELLQDGLVGLEAKRVDEQRPVAGRIADSAGPGVVGEPQRAGEVYEDSGSTGTLRTVATGQLQALETVVEGFEQLPIAINMLFDGTNVGKLVVRLVHD